MTDHTTALDAIAVQLQRIADHLTATADAPTATADDGPRCVCGDPIEQTGDPAYWIHSPGSDTPCLHARPESVTLATPCTGCGHAYNWHGGSKASCQLGDEEKRCGCEGFTTEAQPATTPAGRPACVPDHATTNHCPGCTWDHNHGPADDAEDVVRAHRLASLGVLLSRILNGLTLNSDEAKLLSEHIDAEVRESTTARAVAAGNLRHVKQLVPEIDRLTAELEDAETRADGFRAERDQARHERDVIAADLATAERLRAEAQATLDRVRRLAQYARDRTEVGESDWAIGQHELACAVLDILDSPAETEPPAA